MRINKNARNPFVVIYSGFLCYCGTLWRTFVGVKVNLYSRVSTRIKDFSGMNPGNRHTVGATLETGEVQFVVILTSMHCSM